MNAAGHRADLSDDDRRDMDTRTQQALRLRYWAQVTKGYLARNGAAITKGYGTAAVPDYAKLSRKDALQAISEFPAVATGTGQDKSQAAHLLDALKNLDPREIPDSMIVEPHP